MGVVVLLLLLLLVAAAIVEDGGDDSVNGVGNGKRESSEISVPETTIAAGIAAAIDHRDYQIAIRNHRARGALQLAAVAGHDKVVCSVMTVDASTVQQICITYDLLLVVLNAPDTFRSISPQDAIASATDPLLSIHKRFLLVQCEPRAARQGSR